MHERNGARELGLVIGTLAMLVHFLDGVAFWVITALIVATAVAGSLHLLGESRPWRVPLDRLTLPALAAFATAGLAHLVNPVPWLALVFVGAWIVMALVVAVQTLPATGTEEEEASAAGETAGHPRPLAARIATLFVAFLAFSAVGGFVSGGLASDAATPATSVVASTALYDLIIGGLVGFVMAAIRPHRRMDVVLAFVLYAAILGAAGAALRYVDMPRLLGPAILTLVAYLVTVFRYSAEPIWRSSRLIGETLVLGVAGCAVIVLGLLMR
jgi:Ca2+/Na+ antiporter